jgi:hypothetical protein
VLAPDGRQAVGGGHAEGDAVFSFDHLVGSRHADVLGGDARRNHITGGGGGDTLRGMGGDDIFMFGAADLLGLPARIMDFHPAAAPEVERDGLSLRLIDAVAGGADDAFVFIGTAPFTAAGQLRTWFDGFDTWVEGNTAAGVETAELRIRLVGADFSALLGPADFAL